MIKPVTIRTIIGVVISVSTCIALTACRSAQTAPRAGGATFPIMTWDLPLWSKDVFSQSGHGLDSVAECNFTTAGFVRPSQLKMCERLGLQAIVAPEKFPTKWREMSDQQIFDSVKQLVDESHGSRAVLGYFLTDEPGAGEFAALGKAVAAVKKLAPGKLAYINLFPDYATLGAPDLSQLGVKSYDEYLERFVAEVHPQIISYDNYRIQQSHDLRDKSVAASYFQNLLAVRRVAMEHNLPFWNIASSTQIVGQAPPPSPGNFLLQAYTTLAAGGQGMTWYTYYGNTTYLYAPIDKQNHRTATWSYLKMVNEQIKTLGPILMNLKSTGVYFSSPAPVDGLPPLPGKIVQAVTSATPIMVGEFDGASGEKYVMLVNLSLEASASVKIATQANQIEQVSAVDGSLSPIEADPSIWLTAGAGALLKLTSTPLPQFGSTSSHSDPFLMSSILTSPPRMKDNVSLLPARD